jgi:hypothetical protein
MPRITESYGSNFIHFERSKKEREYMLGDQSPKPPEVYRFLIAPDMGALRGYLCPEAEDVTISVSDPDKALGSLLSVALSSLAGVTSQGSLNKDYQ